METIIIDKINDTMDNYDTCYIDFHGLCKIADFSPMEIECILKSERIITYILENICMSIHDCTRIEFSRRNLLFAKSVYNFGILNNTFDIVNQVEDLEEDFSQEPLFAELKLFIGV